MRSAEDIIHLIKNARIIINPEIKKVALKELIKELRKPKTIGTAMTKPAIWRIIMKSPITKIAAAAAVVIACLTGLFFWKSTGSGIVLADVLARVEQVTSYRYQVSSTMTKEQMAGTRKRTVLVSREHGLRMTIIDVDPNEVKMTRGKYAVGDEWYLLPQSNSVVIVSHEKKTYDRFIYDGVEIDFYKEQYNDPRTIVRQILNCENRSLGQSVIDGITVKGFQTTDPNYGGGFFGASDRSGRLKRADVKLWVDVNTLLPIRLEEDVITEGGLHVHEVNYDFQWNVPIEPDDFKPNIPEDYRAPVGDIVVSTPSEENAIAGLKMFCDLAGKYPDSLEKKAFGEEFKKHMPPDDTSYEELSDEERTKKTNEALLIAGPSFFYRMLAAKKKEPIYYGQFVTPKDFDAVLLRWKLSDNEYRVIFGNLSTKTVTAGELAELEGNSE